MQEATNRCPQLGRSRVCNGMPSSPGSTMDQATIGRALRSHRTDGKPTVWRPQNCGASVSETTVRNKPDGPCVIPEQQQRRQDSARVHRSSFAARSRPVVRRTYLDSTSVPRAPATRTSTVRERYHSSLRGVLGIANPHSSTSPDTRVVRGPQLAQNICRSSLECQKALR